MNKSKRSQIAGFSGIPYNAGRNLTMAEKEDLIGRMEVLGAEAETIWDEVMTEAMFGEPVIVVKMEITPEEAVLHCG